MSVPATNKALFEQLRKLIPDLPEQCSSLTLEMKADCIPMLTVTHRAMMQSFDRTFGTSEWVTQEFSLTPTNADGS